MKKRILALVLCFMMALSACQQGAQEPPISADLPAVVEKTEPVEIPDAEGAVGVDKSETVHVKADADGTPKEITVETVLSKLGDVPSVADVSRLTNIRNTEGDEAFREDGDGDGALTWENHGVSITYEGKSDKEPPVSVHISYYLDGMETEPNALAGKSGRVTIRFDYENHTTQTITVSQADLDAVALKEDEKLDNLEDYETPTETIQQETVVPFLAVSAVMLNDHFSNVEVTNGEVMTVGNDQIVMGYALPNVADVLKLSDWEMTEKVELPDYVEFSADVVDFSLDFTATIVTNGIFEELDEEDLADFDDLAVATKLMKECSEALVDGTKKLSKGAKELSDGVKKYLKGTEALENGIDTLSDGLVKLDKALSKVDFSKDSKTGADAEAIAKDMKALAGTLNSTKNYITSVMEAEQALASINTEDMRSEQKNAVIAAQTTLSNAEIPDLTGAVNALQDLQGQLEALSASMEGISDVAGQMKELKTGISQLADGSKQLKKGVKALTNTHKNLKKGLNALCDGCEELADGMDAFDEEGIAKLSDKTGTHLTDLTAALRSLKRADEGYYNFGGIHPDMTGNVRFVIETEEIS